MIYEPRILKNTSTISRCRNDPSTALVPALKNWWTLPAAGLVVETLGWVRSFDCQGRAELFVQQLDPQQYPATEMCWIPQTRRVPGFHKLELLFEEYMFPSFWVIYMHCFWVEETETMPHRVSALTMPWLFPQKMRCGLWEQDLRYRSLFECQRFRPKHEDRCSWTRFVSVCLWRMGIAHWFVRIRATSELSSLAMPHPRPIKTFTKPEFLHISEEGHRTADEHPLVAAAEIFCRTVWKVTFCYVWICLHGWLVSFCFSFWQTDDPYWCVPNMARAKSSYWVFFA